MSNKKDKLKKLNIENCKNLPSKYVNILYKECILKQKTKKIKQTNKTKIIDTSTERYKVLLKFINKILTNLNKEEIATITDFKNIDRIDIIKDINKKTLNNMSSEIFKYFNKQKCGWYRLKRNESKGIVLHIIRGMCKEIGLSLVFQKKTIFERINDKAYGRTHLIYSIQNI